MGDWAYRAFRRLEDKEGDEHEKRQQQALNRHQILSNAPYLWDKLTKEIQEEIEEFQRPGHLSFRNWSWDGGPGALLTSPEAEIEVGFNDVAPLVRYEVRRKPNHPSASESVENNVIHFGLKDEEVWFFEEGHALSVSDVAEKILDNLIK